MTQIIRMFAALVLAAFALETTVIARPGLALSNGHAAGPTSTKPPKSTKPSAVKPVKVATTVKPVKPVKPAKADIKLAKSTAKADAKAGKHGASSPTATTPAPGTLPSTVVVSNPLADKIARNPNLAAKIQGKLPAGMTLAQASTGFKNQGQFMAAANVSNNLGIDFVKLQASMTGQTTAVDPVTHAIISTPTGVAPLSLGQSIHQLRPGVDADAATTTAAHQTSVMVQTTTAAPVRSKSTRKKSSH
jgi:hypothetical protein